MIFKYISAIGIVQLVYILNLEITSDCLSTFEKRFSDGEHIIPAGQLDEEDSRTNRKEQHLNMYWAQITKNSQVMKGSSNVTSVSLKESAAKLSLFLQKFAELELGLKETKAAFEAVSFDVKQVKSPVEQAKQLANKMTLEMNVYLAALERMVNATKSSFESDSYISTLPLCCDLYVQDFRYFENYKSSVDKSSSCWSVPPRSRRNLYIPGKAFGDVLIANSEMLPNLRWQYFVSPDGVQIQYPSNKQNCPNNNENKTNLRSVLPGKGTSERKPWLIQKPKSDTQIHRIIFLIQLDTNTNDEMIKSVKNIVFRLLKLLDEADEVGIINSEPDQLWSNFICDQMLRTTSWTRFQIINYLNYLENRYKTTNPSFWRTDDINSDSKPDHYLGLEKAIDMACQNSSESSTLFPPLATTIIQISSSGIDTNKFNSQALNVSCPLFIESFFLQRYNSTEEEVFRKAIQNVAPKNIWRVQIFSLGQTDSGAFAEKVALQLNTRKEWWSLSDILSQFFPNENNYSPNLKEFSIPHWNHVSKEFVIVAKRYVFQQGRPLGLVSIEIPLVIFTQHLVSFTNEQICDSKNYVFLIDRNGKVVIHPAFGKLDSLNGTFSSVPIEQVEIYNGFPELKRQILAQENGCASLHSKQENQWITYAWASSLNYIVVLTFFGESGGCASDKYEFILQENALSINDVQYHLLLDKPLCCNNQLISINKAGLYLSPSAFHRPADAINDLSKQNVKRLLALMAYIGDRSGMIQNPTGELKSSTKHHIGVLAPSVPIWKQRYFQSDWNKYILRRFATGGGGTFLLIYPGLEISAEYIPKSTYWFRKALDGQGRLTFSPPTYDSQMKLPIITMSQVINVDLKTPFSQEVYRTSVAVAGADLQAGFLKKLIDDLLPECRNATYRRTNKTESDVASSRCFLVDENGMVIYHPHLIGALHSTSTVHITQIEPLSIIDILQQTQSRGHPPLIKYVCHKVSEASVTQGSLKRMYKFTMGVEGIHKLKHGELCSLYFVVPVPQTNMFLGVVRDSCTSATAFCPCSTIDNLCLNCLRMEQGDCECPCECPREPSFCVRKSFIDLPEDIVPCEFPFEPLPMIRRENVENCHEKELQNDKNLSCDYLRNSCTSITQSTMCTGSWDCEWCLGNLTTPPTCSKYSDCYDTANGNSLTFNNKMVQLHEDGSLLINNTNDFIQNDSQMTLVPILGVLSVFLVFIGLVIYCYRHRALTISDSQPNLHLLPLQENPVGLTGPPPDHRSPSDSDSETDNVPIQIPVVNINRRRNNHNIIHPPRSPVASSVSDLGYSTMTGENISECGASAPLVYLEPPPINSRKKESSTDVEREPNYKSTSPIASSCKHNVVIAPTSVLVHSCSKDDT